MTPSVEGKKLGTAALGTWLSQVPRVKPAPPTVPVPARQTAIVRPAPPPFPAASSRVKITRPHSGPVPPATSRLPLSFQHLVLCSLMSAPFQDVLSPQRPQMVPVAPSFSPSVASPGWRVQFMLTYTQCIHLKRDSSCRDLGTLGGPSCSERAANRREHAMFTTRLLRRPCSSETPSTPALSDRQRLPRPLGILL